jgi:hypothetical protein
MWPTIGSLRTYMIFYVLSMEIRGHHTGNCPMFSGDRSGADRTTIMEEHGKRA